MDIYTFKTPRPQHFSLPYPIMKYILKNATPKAWKKLIQTCKYFFPKNPVFPVYDLQADDNGKWHGDDGRINTNNPVAKLWLYNILFAFHSGLSPTTISSLIPKLSNCSLKAVLFTGQNLTWNEFQFLTSSGSIEWFDFCDCTLKYSDGKFVTFDKVLENFKNVESLYVFLKICM
uniref:Uncharacterized protein n=1 Tax=Panagrolaimus superbus TaxID=310955 RepID=A0A914Y3Q0_9BILA